MKTSNIERKGEGERESHVVAPDHSDHPLLRWQMITCAVAMNDEARAACIKLPVAYQTRRQMMIEKLSDGADFDVGHAAAAATDLMLMNKKRHAKHMSRCNYVMYIYIHVCMNRSSPQPYRTLLRLHLVFFSSDSLDAEK